MHPAFLYLPGARLTLTELTAARLDGDVIELGDAFIPADLVESADVRAGSIAALVRSGTAASGPTAAWIHGAGHAPPSVHHVQRATSVRVRVPPSLRIVFRDTRIADEDLVLRGGIAVASPLRTLLDLTVGLHRDPRLRPWIDDLAATDPTLLPRTLERLNARERVPGTRVARAVLERMQLRRS